MTNSLSFPSSEYVLVSSAYLMSIFSGYKILYWYFNSCEIFCYFLLAYVVSNKKSAIFQIVSPLRSKIRQYKVSLKVLSRFFLCLLVFKILIEMCLCMHPSQFILFGIYTASWFWRFMSFDKFRKLLVIILMCTFFISSLLPIFLKLQ